MTKYDELPVYKASYDLFLAVFQLTKNFKREYKYTVGESLKNEMIELVTLLYRTNSRQDKYTVLQKARESIEVIRLLIRLLKDLHQISLKQFVSINKRIKNVSKQLTGWQKKQKKQIGLPL